jgi:tetratricopeptide (TPR) repeat protein
MSHNINTLVPGTFILLFFLTAIANSVLGADLGTVVLEQRIERMEECLKSTSLNSFLCRTWMAYYMIETGRPDEAEKELRAVLAEHPSCKPAQRILADLTGTDFDGYDPIVFPTSCDGIDPQQFFEIGNYLMLRGDFLLAVESFDRYLDCGGEPVGAYFWRDRAIARESLGDYEGAIDDLKFLVEKWPESETKAEKKIQELSKAIDTDRCPTEFLSRSSEMLGTSLGVIAGPGKGREISRKRYIGARSDDSDDLVVR